jgi:hypothetical protein
MLKRFDKVKNCTIQSLTELNSSFFFQKEEFETIHNLLTTLEPIKLNVEIFCRHEAMLL